MSRSVSRENGPQPKGWRSDQLERDVTPSPQLCPPSLPPSSRRAFATRLRPLAFVLVLAGLHAAMLAALGWGSSPTLNEASHLTAGISNWQFGRFEVYRVNPPLVRMVAALPAMAIGYEEDWSSFSDDPAVRSEFSIGFSFVDANGLDVLTLLRAGRWMCLPFALLGLSCCYCWAAALYGRSAGFAAATLWAFSPNILGHASLLTPDAHASALGLAAVYLFWKWLREPSWRHAIGSGVVLGLAELAKTTMLLLIAVWPLLWLVDRLADRRPDRRPMTRGRWGIEAAMLASRLLVALYVLNLGYGFAGTGQSLGEFPFRSVLFAGPDAGRDGESPRADGRDDRLGGRFAESWLASVPVPLPRDYVLGIDIQQQDFEDYGRRSFLNGVWRETGWWHYYLAAAAMKMPLGTLGLIALALVAPLLPSRSESHRRSDDLAHRAASEAEQADPSAERAAFAATWRDELVLLATPVIVFAVVSVKSGFTEHFRYALPAIPFLFVFASRAFATPVRPEDRPRGVASTSDAASPSDAASSPGQSSGQSSVLRVGGERSVESGAATGAATGAGAALGRVRGIGQGGRSLLSSLWSASEQRPSRLRMLATGLLAAAVVESILVYPNSLSFFNAAAGGPARGYERLRGSNIDWGQDLLRVAPAVRRYLRNASGPSSRAQQTGPERPPQGDAPPPPLCVGILYAGGFDPRALTPSLGWRSDCRIDESIVVVSVNYLDSPPELPYCRTNGVDRDQVMERIEGRRPDFRIGWSMVGFDLRRHPSSVPKKPSR